MHARTLVRPYAERIGEDRELDDLVTEITGIRLVAALSSRSEFESSFVNVGDGRSLEDEVVERLSA